MFHGEISIHLTGFTRFQIAALKFKGFKKTTRITYLAQPSYLKKKKKENQVNLPGEIALKDDVRLGELVAYLKDV